MTAATPNLSRPVRPGTIRRTTALGAVLALVVTLLVGVGPAAALGSIGGTVTGDGSGLVNVTVELATSDGTVMASATTDASGNYGLAVDAGVYDLTARPPAGSSFGASTVTGVEVLDGVTRDVDIVLVTVGAPPALYGTITAAGAPVVGADVLLRASSTSETTTTSDTDGSWVAVPPSRAGQLLVRAAGSCDATTLPERWSLTSSYDVDSLTTYDVEPRFVRIRITVVTADGVPVEGARVESTARAVQEAAPLSGSVTASNGRTTGCPDTFTDPDGQVSFVTVPNSTTEVLIVTPDGGTSVVRDVQVDTSDLDATVAFPPPPVPVSGTVLGWDGQPARGVQVLLEQGGVGRPVAQTAAEETSDGSFSFEATPGDYELILQGGNPADVGPSFRVTRPLTVPSDGGLDLGTWQPPLAGVDLRVSLADTGEEVQVAVVQSGLRPIISADVFGAAGTVSNGGIGFLTNTSATETIPAVMLAQTPYTLFPNSRASQTVPDGYDWPDGGWTVTPGQTGTLSTESLALAPTKPVPVTGRVLQAGQPVEGVVVAVVRGEFVRTLSDGTFSVPARVGTLDIAINGGTSQADAPNRWNGRLRNVVVPEGGLDLGDLELPWVPLDVRVLTPPGEAPVAVDMETNTTRAFLDGGWGLMSWTGGYSGADSEALTADGSPTILWFTPSAETVRFTFTPDADSLYQIVELTRVVQQGGDVLQVQLQREGTPDDLPPTITGATSVTVGESAPNVVLSVSATDPEGEPVTVTWNVLGRSPAPTGATVDLGALDGPRQFDAVATACDPADNCASFTIDVTIEDEPPTLEADLPARIAVGEQATLTAAATDVRDDVTVTVDWGDGSSESVTAGSASHSWATTGTYDVVVEAITDDATTTRTLTIEVEAPPEPVSDGVVTGGGWTGAGPGAGGDGTSFGLQVRALDGVVTGRLTARLHGTGLRLVAEQFDTFAVSDGTVTFSGTARVDGVAGHRFSGVASDGGTGQGVDMFGLTVHAPDGSVRAETTGMVRGQIVVRLRPPSARLR